jgi:C-terminal processing protease CtpA/Prc
MNKPPTFFVKYLTVILICLVAVTTQNTCGHSSPVRSFAIQSSLINPDFEQGRVGQMPDGWSASTSDVGYAVQLIEENPKTGKRAALLRSLPTSQANETGGGNLTQAIDATGLRGRRVRFRAAMRMEGADATARAQLSLHVDRAGKQAGFCDKMDDRPVTSREWKYYEIVGDIDEDAAVVNIGMILVGKGKAWLDDVSLVDLGKPVTPAEPARPLSKRGLENLIAFTRLLGYVRHFYPSDEATMTDWDAFAVEGVRVAEKATDAADLAQKLEKLFHPLAPNLRVFPRGRRPTLGWEPVTRKHELTLKVISYRHIGYGQKCNRPGNAYRSERVITDTLGGKVRVDLPDPLRPFAADLAGDVSVLMPLALYVDADGTLPRGSSGSTSSAATPLVRYSGNDRATRLADVALAWNVFQHFYPYFDVVETDWPGALRASLASAATDTDEKAFLNTLKRMVARLHDGHGGVYHESDVMSFTTPVIFGWVENRLVITKVAAQGASGLEPGDVVLKIDGKDAGEALSEREALISGATPQWQRDKSLRQLRSGAKDSELKLDVQPRTGNPRRVVLRRDAELPTLAEARPPQVGEIKPGVFYLDLERIKDEDFQALLPKLERAQGIIFDMRGYPQVSPAIISHLIDKPVESARWMVPIITVPDHNAPIAYNESGRWNIPPMTPRLRAKIAFITNGRAISYAESYMGIIEAYKLAAIIGEPTAGTNGNVNPFVLPGGYRVAWTGMKVLKHDGSRHHGVGILPTEPVSRTIRGVAEKRDEQLERAIAIVSK